MNPYSVRRCSNPNLFTTCALGCKGTVRDPARRVLGPIDVAEMAWSSQLLHPAGSKAAGTMDSGRTRRSGRGWSRHASSVTPSIRCARSSASRSGWLLVTLHGGLCRAIPGFLHIETCNGGRAVDALFWTGIPGVLLSHESRVPRCNFYRST
jgi:hypothetical protein